jgi:hypothetical protein
MHRQIYARNSALNTQMQEVAEKAGVELRFLELEIDGKFVYKLKINFDDPDVPDLMGPNKK